MFRSKAEVLYVLLAGIFGLFFVVVTPPFQSPDEPNHLLRIYQLSEGRIVGERRERASGGTLPTAVVEATRAFDNLPFAPGARTSAAAVRDRVVRSPRLGAPALDARAFAYFPNTMRYSPVPYAPEVAAMGAARAAHLPVMGALYAARAAAWLTSLILTWLAVRLLPEGQQWSLAALALLPMCVFIVSMASTDAFVISASFLVFGWAGWLRGQRSVRAGSAGVILGFALAVVCLGLSKTGYFLIPAALAIAISDQRRPIRRRIGLVALVIGLTLAIDLGWAWMIRSVITPPRLDPLLDPSAQLDLVLHHPMIFVHAAWTDLSVHASRYYESFIGRLGWLDAALPRWVIAVASALVFFFLFTRASTDAVATFTAVERLALAAIPAATLVLTMLLQYLDWVPVGHPDLRGVLQGRHYYPVAAAFVLACPRVPLPAGWSRARPWVFGLGYGVCLTATAVALWQRYYV